MSCILEYFVVYLLCVYTGICLAGSVELPIGSVVSTSMLGVSHAVQNEKKL